MNTTTPNATPAMDTDCPYIANGYANRKEYLECIADDYGVDVSTVRVMADMLGPSEDFDGLVCALEDMEDMY